MKLRNSDNMRYRWEKSTPLQSNQKQSNQIKKKQFNKIVLINSPYIYCANQNAILDYAIMWNNFNISEIELNNEIFHNIELGKEPNFIIAKNPDLPHINRSFIIQDNSSINVSIITEEFDEYQNINVIPSKGNLTRNLDINSIPYEKGLMYTKNVYFPGNLYSTHDPYILRDFRGQVVQINPYQLNPYTSTIKVYDKVVIKIEFNEDFLHRRHSLKPGVTGLWQVRGRNNIKDFTQWVKLDLEYIDNWSFSLDLRIALQTVSTVLSGTGM